MTEDERLAWNDAVASGDVDRIAREQDTALRRVHERIMNEDPNYGRAGWKQ